VTVSGGSLTVTLTNQNPAAGSIFSDAVRVEKLSAEPYRVKNWSFEADVIGLWAYTGTPTHWTASAAGAINLGTTPNGINAGYVYNGGTLSQPLETTAGAALGLVRGDQLTITLEASGAYSSSGNVLADIRTPGGVSIVGGAQSQPIGVDAYATCTYSFTVSTPEAAPVLVLEGEGNDGGTYAMIDKVRMSYTPAPKGTVVSVN